MLFFWISFFFFYIFAFENRDLSWIKKNHLLLKTGVIVLDSFFFLIITLMQIKYTA